MTVEELERRAIPRISGEPPDIERHDRRLAVALGVVTCLPVTISFQASVSVVPSAESLKFQWPDR